MNDAPYFGIDFGTTNSSMAFYDPEEGRADIILNDHDEARTSSVVYYGEDEILVGQDALNKLEEYETSTDPEERDEVNRRIVRNIKRNLVSPPVIPLPGGKFVRPVEVVAEILKKLKHDAEVGHFDQEIERAVITCPAIFGAREQKVLREAARMAGFGEVELFEEPTAAALAVHERGQRIGKGVLVYDLGAGTFDLAVVVREEDGSFRIPMQPQGDPRCGGEDFDLALYYHCEEISLEKLGRPINLRGDIDQVFLKGCRSKKENLSRSRRSRFSSFLPSEDGLQRFVYEIDRETFEDLIRDRVEGTVQKTAKLLEQAKERGHDVDTVVLIGGSSQVPLVSQMLGEALAIEPRNFAGRTHAVALGAAYHAFELWKPKEQAASVQPEALESVVEKVFKLGGWTPDDIRNTGLLRTLIGHSDIVWSVAFSIDGQLFASGSDDGTVKLWDPQSGEEIQTLTGRSGNVHSVAFSPDGKLLASGGMDTSGETVMETVNLWNPYTGELLRILAIETWACIESVAFSPDGQLLASSGWDKTVKLWHPHTGKLLRTLTGHEKDVWSVAFSPNGQLLASGSLDQTVKLWNLRTGELLQSLTEHRGSVYALAFSPNGQLLASGSGGDKPIKLWNPHTGKLLRTPIGHETEVASVAFSPDSQLLASGGADNTVKLWDAKTGELLRTLTGHSGFGASVAFNPDGQLLASGSGDNTIKIWGKS